MEAGRLLRELAQAGLLDHVRGERYRMHDAVRAFAAERLAADEDRAASVAAHERLIRNYAQLADSVIRMVDGKMSTRSNQFGGHGFASLDAALRWLDDESSFITAALRHSEGVDQQAVLDLLGALCDFCLLRGDLYRLGEINELTRAVDQGRLARSVQWRTGIAARQLGELDKARTTLTSVVDQYREAHQDAGAGMALISLGITLHHQGQLTEASARIREALVLQEPQELAGDRAWGAARAGRGGAGPGAARGGGGAAGAVAGAAPGERERARGGLGAFPARPGVPADGRGRARGGRAAPGPGVVRAHARRPRRGLGPDPAGPGPGTGRRPGAGGGAAP
ncbi:hypothetical protein GCM10020254_34450 [Streptomyces goshikiensis]